MFRPTLLIVLWLAVVDAHADNPPAVLIAASNQQVVSSLPPLPHGTSITVLIQYHDDDYATVNTRGLAMRHAKYFVSDSEDSSKLSQMFRDV